MSSKTDDEINALFKDILTVMPQLNRLGASRILHVSTKTIDVWIKKGCIPTYQMQGEHPRFAQAELDELKLRIKTTNRPQYLICRDIYKKRRKLLDRHILKQEVCEKTPG